MDKALQQRLDILLSAGTIDEPIVQVVKEFIAVTERTLAIPLTEENGSMFVTHLAMALARIKQGEVISPIDEALLSEEVLTCPIYPKIPEIIGEVERRTEIKLPHEEYGYVALHLCSLYLANLAETQE